MLYRVQKDRLVHGLLMEGFYDYTGISRQAYFQQLVRKKAYEDMCTMLKNRVLEYRKNKDARAGSRSLYMNLNIKEEFQIGISKFEQIMREQDLTMRPLRIKVVTTKSSYRSWCYPNLINGLELTDINQVVAGDLTYLDICRDRYFIFTLTDLYSARIVGIEISNRMRSDEAYACLQQWIVLRGKQNLKGCIHHTDGGSQYFSKLYLPRVQSLDIQISVAGNCLENGYAEQQNGLIKNHLIPTIKYYPGMNIQRELMRKNDFYNNERKQQRLGWLSPVEFEHKWYMNEQRPKMELYDFDN